MQNNLLFTYGTLKKGHERHCVLEQGAIWVGYSTTKDKYIMGANAFPLVFKQETLPGCEHLAHRVNGEVYRIPDGLWALLDQIEGNGKFYTREIVELECGRKAWMYLIPDAYMADYCYQCELNEEGEYEW